MSRWSPTVIDEGFDLGGIIDRIAQGYSSGRQQKEDRRRRQRVEGREDEDRNLYLRSLREGDLARPGGRDLGEFLGDPEAAQMTPETLARVGRADQPTVPIAFERPAPTEITVPGQEEPIMFQERAPYVTASGVVMDPSAARGEQTLSTALDEQMKRRFDEPSETRIERIGDEAEARARGTAAGTPDKPPEVPAPSLDAVMRAVGELYGTWDPNTEGYTYSFGQERLREIVGRLMGTDFPTVVGPEPEPVEEPEPAEGISFWDSLRNKFVPGQPYPKDAAAPADTTGMRTALEPGKQAGEVTRYATPSPSEVSPDLTIAQRQEMAAKEWEELVNAGTEPDEATRLLREKYGLPGGQ